MRASWQALLVHPRLPLLAALLAVALASPALATGLVGDDWFHRGILLGMPGLDGDPRWTLFTFMDGGPRDWELQELGVLTWWTGPQVKTALFRPLTALTHMLDYALWPDNIPLQHLHNLLWFGLAVALVARLYRRVHPDIRPDIQAGAPAVAGLAALLFAVEDAHAMPAAWIANRNAVITLTLGTGAILAHLRWRAGGGARWLGAALALLASGLLAGEAALGAVGYLAAWQLAREEGPLARRLAPLLPYAALIVAWRLVYNALGYGAAHSGLYIDPGHDPAAFASALARRWPLLLAGQWLQLPIDLWPLLPTGGRRALTAAGFAGAAAVAVVLWPLRGQRDARFWALGMALSLVPLCAAFPMDRLLLFAGIGAMALLALLSEAAAAAGASAGRRRLAGLLLLIHGPLAAVLLAARAASMPFFGAIFAAGALHAPADAAVPGQTFIFVQGLLFSVSYTPLIRQIEAVQPSPRRVALLASALTRGALERLDERTLRITVPEGWLAQPIDTLFRDAGDPFAVGERVTLPDYTVEIEAVTEEGQAEVVRFTFAEPLESPAYRWMSSTATGVEPFVLPAVGERVELEPIELLSGFSGAER